MKAISAKFSAEYIQINRINRDLYCKVVNQKFFTHLGKNIRKHIKSQKHCLEKGKYKLTLALNAAENERQAFYGTFTSKNIPLKVLDDITLKETFSAANIASPSSTFCRNQLKLYSEKYIEDGRDIFLRRT